MTDTAQLRELAEKATPGGWCIGRVMYPYVHVNKDPDKDGYCEAIGSTRTAHGQEHDEANAAYIAAANPQTILTLLDELESARAVLARVDKLTLYKTHRGDSGRLGEQEVDVCLVCKHVDIEHGVGCPVGLLEAALTDHREKFKC